MSAPSDLLITRHGEARCNRDQFVGGTRGCTGLTDLGRHQVAQLAVRLRHEHLARPVEALYTSPLLRTQQSAAIIAESLEIDVRTEPALREQDYGDADGRPWPEVVSEFGGIPSLEPDRPLAPGAETWTQYLHRAAAALKQILGRHEGQRILIVGHGETIDASFRLLLDLPAARRTRAGFTAHPASLTRWTQQPVSWTRPDAGWRWMLQAHNDADHLRQTTADSPPVGSFIRQDG
jgi:probable phosphoglycerate mutase